jgi:hypothetical protein
MAKEKRSEPEQQQGAQDDEAQQQEKAEPAQGQTEAPDQDDSGAQVGRRPGQEFSDDDKQG